MESQKNLTPAQSRALLTLLEERFWAGMYRHRDLRWEPIQARLEQQPDKLWSLGEMERTGGQPDVVGWDSATGAYAFYDCAPQTPEGRRSICYDPAALATRKEPRPLGSALGMAAEMGIRLLDEAKYRALQQLEEVDTKSSSWLLTPDPIRQLGGALFGDSRYGRTFVYHNGAQSYYAGRGFRGWLMV